MAHIEIIGDGLCPIYIVLERADGETVIQGVFMAEADAIECCKNILQAFIDNKWDFASILVVEEWDLNHSIHCELAMFCVSHNRIKESYYGSMRKANKE